MPPGWPASNLTRIIRAELTFYTIQEMDKSLRLFTALGIPEAIRQEIETFRTGLPTDGVKLKWEKSQNLHITLKFLGNTERNLVEKIITVLEGIAGEHREITTTLTRFGFFPNVRNPRIAWIAPDPEATTRIVKIHSPVESMLRREGFMAEKRRYHPHVTIARIKACWDPPEHFIGEFEENFSGEPFAIDRIILYESRLRPEGACYKPIQTFPLKAR